MNRSMAFKIAIVAMLGLGVPVLVMGYDFIDDFNDGIDPMFWLIDDNDGLYTVDATQGDVRFSKSVGGDHNFQMAMIRFRGRVQGDFDISVDFRDAFIDQVDGLPGNQVQLNTGFGGQTFCVVRSDEPNGGGHNHHVFINPPGIWVGAQPDESTAGAMRIRRMGTLVEGHIHGALIYSGYYNDGDLTYLSCSLNNNGTIDSTSVTFDDFQFTADAVTAIQSSSTRSQVVFAPPWPNPASGQTCMGFDLHFPGHVILSVFDIRGHRLSTLVHENMLAGFHTIPWSGCDDQGRLLPGGVYFIRLVTGHFSVTKRLVLIR